MDYIGKKCPVCQKYFHADEDIVVCPDCGTPHHRECWEKTGACVNAARHSEGYDYTKDSGKDENTVLICRSCGEENDKNAFFCKRCGKPLPENNKDASPPPFGYGAGGFGSFSGRQADRQDDDSADGYRRPEYSMPFSDDFFDPLGGVDRNADLGDGVTAGEAAKYVKQNTPYFIRVFSNIKNFSRSKFNFAAAIFTGTYLLYRKMYKLGALLVAIQLGLLIAVTCIEVSSTYTNISNHLVSLLSAANASASAEARTVVIDYMLSLSMTDYFMLFFPVLVETVDIAMMITVGACANRLYFNHCKKQIVKIKESAAEKNPDGGEPLSADEQLQTKGGVNTALGASLLITSIIINYLPYILTNFF